MTGFLTKIFCTLYNLYPVKIYARNRAEDYFFKYHVARILRDSSKVYSIGDCLDIKDLINMSPFRGLLGEFVRVGDYYPSPKDIAVAISISVGAYGKEGRENRDDIIDLAFHVSQELKSVFISDLFLRGFYEESNKDLSKLTIESERREIEKLFESKKEMFVSFFSTFSKSEFSYSIKIWHQSQENSFIEWQEKDAITIHLDPLRIREGFFQVGFDYYCNKKKKRLQYATRNRGLEFFDGDLKDEIIWAR